VNNDKLYHRELSFNVVGCAQKVHAALGPGSPESVYHRALAHELAKAKIPFENQKHLEVRYDSVPCGEFKLDMLVDGAIVLELKALDRLTDLCVAQAISYLKATGLRLAILLNFGTESLETKRVVL